MLWSLLCTGSGHVRGFIALLSCTEINKFKQEGLRTQLCDTTFTAIFFFAMSPKFKRDIGYKGCCSLSFFNTQIKTGGMKKMLIHYWASRALDVCHRAPACVGARCTLVTRCLKANLISQPWNKTSEDLIRRQTILARHPREMSRIVSERVSTSFGQATLGFIPPKGRSVVSLARRRRSRARPLPRDSASGGVNWHWKQVNLVPTAMWCSDWRVFFKTCWIDFNEM